MSVSGGGDGITLQYGIDGMVAGDVLNLFATEVLREAEPVRQMLYETACLVIKLWRQLRFFCQFHDVLD